jgi:hypothetical protein
LPIESWGLKIRPHTKPESAWKIQELRKASATFSNLTNGYHEIQVTGQIQNTEHMITSASRYFKIEKLQALPPPVAQLPLNNSALASSRVEKSGLFLRWDKVQDAVTYNLKIKMPSGQIKEFQTQFTQWRIESPQPGQYHWKVAAKDIEGDISKFSETYNFNIEDVEKLWWTDKIPELVFYALETPKIKIKWASERSDIDHYRYLIKSQSDVKTNWQITAKEAAEINIVDPGVYDIQVQGVASDDALIAQSDVRKIRIEQAPLPPAPSLKRKETFVASRDGKIELRWDPIFGVKEYAIHILNSQGKELKTEKTEGNEYKRRRFLPGNYEVQVFSVDEYGRRSRTPASIKLNVTKTNDLKPTKFKKVKIK